MNKHTHTEGEGHVKMKAAAEATPGNRKPAEARTEAWHILPLPQKEPTRLWPPGPEASF